MGFVSGSAARRCERKPSCRTVPTPGLDRMRKAGAVPASQICQQDSLLQKRELANGSEEAQSGWDFAQKVRCGLSRKCRQSSCEEKKSPPKTSLFCENDLVTSPLALDLSLSLPSTTDCSPDGQNAWHKHRLTMGRGGRGKLKMRLYCCCCQKHKARRWTWGFKIKRSLKIDMECNRATLIDLPRIWCERYGSLRVGSITRDCRRLREVFQKNHKNTRQAAWKYWSFCSSATHLASRKSFGLNFSLDKLYLALARAATLTDLMARGAQWTLRLTAFGRDQMFLITARY